MVGPILKGDRLAKIMGAMYQTQKAVSKETAFAINLVAGAHNPRCRILISQL
jgi:hypothetical protein